MKIFVHQEGVAHSPHAVSAKEYPSLPMAGLVHRVETGAESGKGGGNDGSNLRSWNRSRKYSPMVAENDGPALLPGWRLDFIAHASHRLHRTEYRLLGFLASVCRGCGE